MYYKYRHKEMQLMYFITYFLMALIFKMRMVHSSLDCGAGSYQASADATVCTACERGKYQDEPNQVQCKQCPAGYSKNAFGSTSCDECAAGQYSSQEGALNCPSTCSYYYSTPGASSCQYTSTTCPKGHYSHSHCVAMQCTNSCRRCPRGKYGDAVGYTDSDQCKQCPTGRYGSTAALTAVTACTLCDEGRYSNELGALSCDNQCPVGHYSNEKGLSLVSECKKCQAGQYSDAKGLSNCKPCSFGTFQDIVGNTTCKECPPGRFSNTLGLSICDECETGTFINTSGAIQCEDCGMNEYQNITGQVTCEDCASGKYAVSGAVICSDLCPKGHYADGDSCSMCPAGRWSDVIGLTAAFQCKYCEAGRYSNETGQIDNTHCKECVAGTFADAQGSTKCNNCPIGRYAPNLGTIVCEACSGTVVNRTICLAECDIGYEFQTRDNVCLHCPPGSHPVNGVCLKCAVGTFSNTLGASECSICPNGYLTTESRETCGLCEPGQYQNALTNILSCDACESGRYQPEAGKTTCLGVMCAAGQFGTLKNILMDEAICYECIPGRFQADAGQSECVLCPSGKYQENVGYNECNDCPVNTMGSASYSATGQTECGAGCPSGAACTPIELETDLPWQQVSVSEFRLDLGTEPSHTLAKMTEDFHVSYTVPITGWQDANKVYDGVERYVYCEKTTASGSTWYCADDKPYYWESGKYVCKDCYSYKNIYGHVHTTLSDWLSENDFEVDDSTLNYGSLPKTTSTSTRKTFFKPNFKRPLRVVSTRKGRRDETYVGRSIKVFKTLFERQGTGATMAEAIDDLSLGYETGALETHNYIFDLHAGTKTEKGYTVLNLPFGKSYSGGQINDIDTFVSELSKIMTSFRISRAGNIVTFKVKKNSDGIPYNLEVTSCAAGSVLFEANCEPCAVGTYGVKGAVECTACPNGKYQNQVGQSSCKSCSAGTESRSKTTKDCRNCPAGKYRDSSMAECAFCAKGYYQVDAGQSECLKCPKNKYGDGVGLNSVSACKDCPDGSNSEEASTSITNCAFRPDCPIGKYLSARQDGCLSCPPGRFSDVTGLTKVGQLYLPLIIEDKACKGCPAGFFQNQYGQTSCKETSAGFYEPDELEISDEADDEDHPCPAGRYSIRSGLSSVDDCTKCPKGYYQEQTSATSCKACAKGKQSDISGSESEIFCEKCPVGQYSNVEGAFGYAFPSIQFEFMDGDISSLDFSHMSRNFGGSISEQTTQMKSLYWQKSVFKFSPIADKPIFDVFKCNSTYELSFPNGSLASFWTTKRQYNAYFNGKGTVDERVEDYFVRHVKGGRGSIDLPFLPKNNNKVHYHATEVDVTYVFDLAGFLNSFDGTNFPPPFTVNSTLFEEELKDVRYNSRLAAFNFLVGGEPNDYGLENYTLLKHPKQAPAGVFRGGVMKFIPTNQNDILLDTSSIFFNKTYSYDIRLYRKVYKLKSWNSLVEWTNSGEDASIFLPPEFNVMDIEQQNNLTLTQIVNRSIPKKTDGSNWYKLSSSANIYLLVSQNEDNEDGLPYLTGKHVEDLTLFPEDMQSLLNQLNYFDRGRPFENDYIYFKQEDEYDGSVNGNSMFHITAEATLKGPNVRTMIDIFDWRLIDSGAHKDAIYSINSTLTETTVQSMLAQNSNYTICFDETETIYEVSGLDFDSIQHDIDGFLQASRAKGFQGNIDGNCVHLLGTLDTPEVFDDELTDVINVTTHVPMFMTPELPLGFKEYNSSDIRFSHELYLKGYYELAFLELMARHAHQKCSVRIIDGDERLKCKQDLPLPDDYNILVTLQKNADAFKKYELKLTDDDVMYKFDGENTIDISDLHKNIECTNGCPRTVREFVNLMNTTLQGYEISLDVENNGLYTIHAVAYDYGKDVLPLTDYSEHNDIDIFEAVSDGRHSHREFSFMTLTNQNNDVTSLYIDQQYNSSEEILTWLQSQTQLTDKYEVTLVDDEITFVSKTSGELDETIDCCLSEKDIDDDELDYIFATVCEKFDNAKFGEISASNLVSNYEIIIEPIYDIQTMARSLTQDSVVKRYWDCRFLSASSVNTSGAIECTAKNIGPGYAFILSDETIPYLDMEIVRPGTLDVAVTEQLPLQGIIDHISSDLGPYNFEYTQTSMSIQIQVETPSSLDQIKNLQDKYGLRRSFEGPSFMIDGQKIYLFDSINSANITGQTFYDSIDKSYLSASLHTSTSLYYEPSIMYPYIFEKPDDFQARTFYYQCRPINGDDIECTPYLNFVEYNPLSLDFFNDKGKIICANSTYVMPFKDEAVYLRLYFDLSSCTRNTITMRNEFIKEYDLVLFEDPEWQSSDGEKFSVRYKRLDTDDIFNIQLHNTNDISIPIKRFHEDSVSNQCLHRPLYIYNEAFDNIYSQLVTTGFGLQWIPGYCNDFTRESEQECVPQFTIDKGCCPIWKNKEHECWPPDSVNGYMQFLPREKCGKINWKDSSTGGYCPDGSDKTKDECKDLTPHWTAGKCSDDSEKGREECEDAELDYLNPIIISLYDGTHITVQVDATENANTEIFNKFELLLSALYTVHQEGNKVSFEMKEPIVPHKGIQHVYHGDNLLEIFYEFPLYQNKRVVHTGNYMEFFPPEGERGFPCTTAKMKETDKFIESNLYRTSLPNGKILVRDIVKSSPPSGYKKSGETDTLNVLTLEQPPFYEIIDGFGGYIVMQNDKLDWQEEVQNIFFEADVVNDIKTYGNIYGAHVYANEQSRQMILPVMFNILPGGLAPYYKGFANMNIDQCHMCAPGQYQDKSGKTHCKLAQKGQYVSSWGEHSLTSSKNDCPKGTYGVDTGTDNIEDCRSCSPGKYQNQVGQLYCEKAPPGSYTDSAKSEYHIQCPVGKYQNEAGQTGCKNCRLATEATQPGRTRCTPCPTGKYAGPQTGCLTCTSKLQCPLTGMPVPYMCAPGTYSTFDYPLKMLALENDADTVITYNVQDYRTYAESKANQNFRSGLKACAKCTPGFYQDEYGQQSCKEYSFRETYGATMNIEQVCFICATQDGTVTEHTKQDACENAGNTWRLKKQNEIPTSHYAADTPSFDECAKLQEGGFIIQQAPLEFKQSLENSKILFTRSPRFYFPEVAYYLWDGVLETCTHIDGDEVPEFVQTVYGKKYLNSKESCESTVSNILSEPRCFRDTYVQNKDLHNDYATQGVPMADYENVNTSYSMLKFQTEYRPSYVSSTIPMEFLFYAVDVDAPCPSSSFLLDFKECNNNLDRQLIDLAEYSHPHTKLQYAKNKCEKLAGISAAEDIWKKMTNFQKTQVVKKQDVSIPHAWVRVNPSPDAAQNIAPKKHVPPGYFINQPLEATSGYVSYDGINPEECPMWKDGHWENFQNVRPKQFHTKVGKKFFWKDARDGECQVCPIGFYAVNQQVPGETAALREYNYEKGGYCGMAVGGTVFQSSSEEYVLSDILTEEDCDKKDGYGWITLKSQLSMGSKSPCSGCQPGLFMPERNVGQLDIAHWDGNDFKMRCTHNDCPAQMTSRDQEYDKSYSASNVVQENHEDVVQTKFARYTSRVPVQLYSGDIYTKTHYFRAQYPVSATCKYANNKTCVENGGGTWNDENNECEYAKTDNEAGAEQRCTDVGGDYEVTFEIRSTAGWGHNGFWGTQPILRNMLGGETPEGWPTYFSWQPQALYITQDSSAYSDGKNIGHSCELCPPGRYAARWGTYVECIQCTQLVYDEDILNWVTVTAETERYGVHWMGQQGQWACKENPIGYQLLKWAGKFFAKYVGQLLSSLIFNILVGMPTQVLVESSVDVVISDEFIGHSKGKKYCEYIRGLWATPAGTFFDFLHSYYGEGNSIGVEYLSKLGTDNEIVDKVYETCQQGGSAFRKNGKGLLKGIGAAMEVGCGLKPQLNWIMSRRWFTGRGYDTITCEVMFLEYYEYGYFDYTESKYFRQVAHMIGKEGTVLFREEGVQLVEDYEKYGEMERDEWEEIWVHPQRLKNYVVDPANVGMSSLVADVDFKLLADIDSAPQSAYEYARTCKPKYFTQNEFDKVVNECSQRAVAKCARRRVIRCGVENYESANIGIKPNLPTPKPMKLASKAAMSLGKSNTVRKAADKFKSKSKPKTLFQKWKSGSGAMLGVATAKKYASKTANVLEKSANNVGGRWVPGRCKHKYNREEPCESLEWGYFVPGFCKQKTTSVAITVDRDIDTDAGPIVWFKEGDNTQVRSATTRKIEGLQDARCTNGLDLGCNVYDFDKDKVTKTAYKLEKVCYDASQVSIGEALLIRYLTPAEFWSFEYGLYKNPAACSMWNKKCNMGHFLREMKLGSTTDYETEFISNGLSNSLFEMFEKLPETEKDFTRDSLRDKEISCTVDNEINNNNNAVKQQRFTEEFYETLADGAHGDIKDGMIPHRMRYSRNRKIQEMTIPKMLEDLEPEHLQAYTLNYRECVTKGADWEYIPICMEFDGDIPVKYLGWNIGEQCTVDYQNSTTSVIVQNLSSTIEKVYTGNIPQSHTVKTSLLVKYCIGDRSLSQEECKSGWVSSTCVKDGEIQRGVYDECKCTGSAEACFLEAFAPNEDAVIQNPALSEASKLAVGLRNSVAHVIGKGATLFSFMNRPNNEFGEKSWASVQVPFWSSVLSKGAGQVRQRGFDEDSLSHTSQKYEFDSLAIGFNANIMKMIQGPVTCAKSVFTLVQNLRQSMDAAQRNEMGKAGTKFLDMLLQSFIIMMRCASKRTSGDFTNRYDGLKKLFKKKLTKDQPKSGDVSLEGGYGVFRADCWEFYVDTDTGEPSSGVKPCGTASPFITDPYEATAADDDTFDDG